MTLRSNKYFPNTIYRTASVMEKRCAFWEWRHEVLHETLFAWYTGFIWVRIFIVAKRIL